jgi:hypothetical protein
VLAQAVARALDLHDHRVMQEAVEEGSGHDGVAEHCGLPLCRIG